MRRLRQPEDIGGVIVFLSSLADAYVTGAELPVEAEPPLTQTRSTSPQRSFGVAERIGG